MKIRYALIFLALLLAFVTISSAGNTEVSLGDYEVEEDETVRTAVMVNDVTDVVGGEVNITFNPSVVNVSNVSDGEIGSVTSNVDNQQGWVYLNVYGSEGMDGDVVFAYLNFTAVGGEGENSELNISVDSLFNTNYEEISSTVNHGGFNVKAVPPSSVSSLQNTTYQESYIKWTWEDPADSDFSHVRIYLNGQYQGKVDKGVEYYSATDLSSGKTYEISTRTVDSWGNVNATWVNHSAKTAPESGETDITPPPSITNLESITGDFWINWSWDNPSNFSHTMVYVDGQFVTNTSNSYYNASYSPHATRTISTHTVDSSGNVNSTWVNQTTTIPNNAPEMETIDDRSVMETENLVVEVNATDADSDSLTYSCNRTDLFRFNSTTGAGNWSPQQGDAGTYYVELGVSDGYGESDSETMRIEVTEFDDQPPVIENASVSPSLLLNDNGRARPSGTATAQIQVEVTDNTGVQSVEVSLTPVGRSQQAMSGGGGSYSASFTAVGGTNKTHNITITATDQGGNTNSTSVELTVLKRGDVYRDNKVDMKDAMYIARYLADLEPEASHSPSELVGDVVGSEGVPEGDGEVDMKDAVYIARYKAGYEVMP